MVSGAGGKRGVGRCVLGGQCGGMSSPPAVSLGGRHPDLAYLSMWLLPVPWDGGISSLPMPGPLQWVGKASDPDLSGHRALGKLSGLSMPCLHTYSKCSSTEVGRRRIVQGHGAGGSLA